MSSRFVTLAVLSAIVLIPGTALAKHHHHAEGGVEGPDDDDEHGERGEHGDHGDHDRDDRDGSAKHAAASDDDDTADDDGGAPVVVDRTPAQKERRDQLVAKEHELVLRLAHAHGRRISLRDRQAIGLHWRHVMRLSRIRELAEQDHDTALLARIDALLEKADKKFTAGMTETDGGAR